MLLLTHSANVSGQTNRWAVVALIVCAVIAGTLYLLGRHSYLHFLHRYQELYNTPRPMGYFERLEAQLTGKPTDSREQFMRMWRRQSDPDLEGLRVRALTLFTACYVLWGAAVILVVP